MSHPIKYNSTLSHVILLVCLFNSSINLLWYCLMVLTVRWFLDPDLPQQLTASSTPVLKRCKLIRVQEMMDLLSTIPYLLLPLALPLRLRDKLSISSLLCLHPHWLQFFHVGSLKGGEPPGSDHWYEHLSLKIPILAESHAIFVSWKCSRKWTLPFLCQWAVSYKKKKD